MGVAQLAEDLAHDVVIAFAEHGPFNFAGINVELSQISAPGDGVRGVRVDDHSVEVENQRQSGRHVRGKIHFERMIT